MRWRIADWEHDGEGFELPDGAIAAFDLREDPTAEGLALFCGELKKGVDCGSGDFREIKPGKKVARQMGVEGDTLAELVREFLIKAGGQPDKKNCITITIGGQVARWGGRKFENGTLPHLRKKMRRLFEKNPRKARKVLGYELKRRGGDWRRMVPRKYRTDEFAPLKPATTITDNFNGGAQLTWTVHTGTWSFSSDVAHCDAAGAMSVDGLSSDDHFAQGVITAHPGSLSPFGPAVRVESYANQYGFARRGSDGAGRLRKRVANSLTNLTGWSGSSGLDTTWKLDVQGGALSGTVDGVEVSSTTDTSLSGETSVGWVSYSGGSGRELDAFQASDGVAVAESYVKLERDARGVERGIYTGIAGIG